MQHSVDPQKLSRVHSECLILKTGKSGGTKVLVSVLVNARTQQLELRSALVASAAEEAEEMLRPCVLEERPEKSLPLGLRALLEVLAVRGDGEVGLILPQLLQGEMLREEGIGGRRNRFLVVELWYDLLC